MVLTEHCSVQKPQAQQVSKMSEERATEPNGATAAGPSENFKAFVGGISWHTTDKALSDGAWHLQLCVSSVIAGLPLLASKRKP